MYSQRERGIVEIPGEEKGEFELYNVGCLGMGLRNTTDALG
jgi:hypothetical protein